MWTEWEAIVRATAPMLATKHIEYWAEQAVNGYGIANVFPVYDSSAAYNLMAPTLQQIWSQKVNVTTGYTQMAQQINALQQTAAAELGQAAALTKQFSVNGRSIAEVPTGV